MEERKKSAAADGQNLLNPSTRYNFRL